MSLAEARPTSIRPRLGGLAALITAIGGALYLGLNHLAEDSFWVDEGTSIWIAKMDWSSFWHVVTQSEANSSLYYALLHVWVTIADGEFFVRTLSVVFAVATLPFLFALVSRLFGFAAAAIACAALATNAFFVQYSQEARGYSLALLLVTISSYLLVRELDSPSGLGWVMYVLVSSAAVYAHFHAAFVLAAQAVSLALLSPKRIEYGRRLAAFGAIAALVSPLLFFIATKDAGQVDWLRKPTAQVLDAALLQVTGGVDELKLIYGGLLLLYVVLWVVAWRREGRTLRVWGFGFVFLWLVVPIAGSYGVSLVKPLFHPRFLVITLAPLGAVAGIALAGLRRWWLWALPTLLVVVASLRGVTVWYDHEKEPWRSVTDLVTENAQPGDRIVFFSATIRRPVEYYVDLSDSENRMPESIYPAGEWLTYPVTLFPYRPNRSRIRREASEAERIWYAVGHGGRARTRLVENRILDACSEVSGRWFRGRVRLYTGCGSLTPSS
jgi:mannosyltransferase